MMFQQIVGWSLAVVIFIAGLSTIGAIMWGWIWHRRTRGAHERLRNPDPRAIEEACHFPPPAGLLKLYRSASYIEQSEFYLVDRSRKPIKAWYIAWFFPLTKIDLKAWTSTLRPQKGIPIGADADKGIYFVSERGAVMLASPSVEGRIVEVAPNIATFSEFEAYEEWPEKA